MKQLSVFSISFLLISCALFFMSAAIPPIGVVPGTQKENRQELRLSKLEQKAIKTQNSRKQAKIEQKMDKIKAQKEGNMLGLLGFIFGLTSLVFAILGWFLSIPVFFAGAAFSLTAIILSAIALKKSENKIFPIIGLIAGGLVFLFIAIGIILLLAVIL